MYQAGEKRFKVCEGRLDSYLIIELCKEKREFSEGRAFCPDG
jgi:hypothetical protein